MVHCAFLRELRDLLHAASPLARACALGLLLTGRVDAAPVDGYGSGTPGGSLGETVVDMAQPAVRIATLGEGLALAQA